MLTNQTKSTGKLQVCTLNDELQNDLEQRKSKLTTLKTRR